MTQLEPCGGVGPSCRAAAQASDAIDPNGESCIRDEQSARVRLNQQWKNFTPAQHEQCVRLSTLGGSPSYAELLTCLEIAKQAVEIPDDSPATDCRPVR